ncbi:signal peptide peptidase SppA [Chelatococcus daeguensis]|uniref:signal peptide peptidase SppA n=1 Tax=Chelatococcus daeguensis TaxID=444444 RepID=UPI0007ABF47F|nr:signal peptide peptidase SppA [Chelatococcus daeguensis]KZE34719.1 protease [Chelatococcus daeguensis]MBM3082561.1 signal peptide peptidase SppA [Chelatococcus daeguensis]
MTYDADIMADRRRLRRKLSFWRVLAVFALIAVVVALGARFGAGSVVTGDQIAAIRIGGFISGDQRTLDLIRRVKDARSVRAVLVRVDSPGGTTSGAEAIYTALRELAAEKPTVALVDGLAASGGYITALAAERIVSRDTSLVGSIGVLIQYPNLAGLLDTLGVKVEEVKSSPLKAAPNGFEPTSPEARAALESVVRDSFAWFKGLVGQRRSLSGPALDQVSDGRVFTGRQAKELGLVDELGGQRQAVAWLEKEKKLASDLPVREWKAESERLGLSLWSLLGRAAAFAGYDDLAGALRAAALREEAGRLDGLLAVWHPSLQNN